MNENWNTQQTLIQRAQNQDDHQAWDDFVSYYESFIKMVLRKANISLSDEDDLIQKVLLRIWKGLPSYAYQKEKARFRTWLSTIIRNTVITHINRDKSKGEKHNSYLQEVDIVSESAIEEVIHQEWMNYVSSIAMKKVEEAEAEVAKLKDKKKQIDLAMKQIAKAKQAEENEKNASSEEAE